MVVRYAAKMTSPQVEDDLGENHGRQVARSYLQNLSLAVGSIAQAKEDVWHYIIPKLDEPVKTIGIGVDGTSMERSQEGYRQAMVGTISLYNEEGERLHTIYQGATPEYGKATFWKRMDRCIADVKSIYPHSNYVGIADGAADNWAFLEQHTDKQTLDFYHVSGYLEAVASIAEPNSKKKRQKWLDEHCHQLKHELDSAGQILSEIKTFRTKKLGKKVTEQLESTITYFENHQVQMDYSQSLGENLPIGSGVTEAACKTLVKQRLCQSFITWKEAGAGLILGLRTLVLTKERWKQFWDKINQYGLPIQA